MNNSINLRDVLATVLPFPSPLLSIICEFEQNEKWAPIQPKTHRRIMSEVLSCLKKRNDSELAKALNFGDLTTAINLIKLGATPKISGQQFEILLKMNRLRILNFICAQMSFYVLRSQDNRLETALNVLLSLKSPYNPKESDFYGIKKVVLNLKPPEFSVGLMIYLRHVPFLCRHEERELSKKAQENGCEEVIVELDKQKILPECTCREQRVNYFERVYDYPEAYHHHMEICLFCDLPNCSCRLSEHCSEVAPWIFPMAPLTCRFSLSNDPF